MSQDYRCTKCGERQFDDPPGVIGGKTALQKLLRKRAQWITMGSPAKGDKIHFRQVKVRTTGWHCLRCVEKDPEWNLPNGRDRLYTGTSIGMNARSLDNGESETTESIAPGVPEESPATTPVLDQPPT